MKKIKHLFFALVATTILSCSNNDDSVENTNQCNCLISENTYLPESEGGDIVLQEYRRENKDCELNNTENTETLPSGRTKITIISDCQPL